MAVGESDAASKGIGYMRHFIFNREVGGFEYVPSGRIQTIHVYLQMLPLLRKVLSKRERQRVFWLLI